MSAWSILTVIRDNPDILRESQRRRRLDPNVIDGAVRLDTEWRKSRTELAKLQQQRNLISQQISKTKDEAERNKLIQETKHLAEKVTTEEERIADLEKQRLETLSSIPNIVHSTVPDGKDETENQPVKYVGKPRVWKGHLEQFLADAQGLPVKYDVTDQPLKSHYEISEEIGLIDTERAAKVAGSRFFYLLGDIVWLDLALALYALDSITKHGFTPIVPPHLLNYAAYSGVTDLGAFEDALYKLEEQDLYLIATSEHPIAARFMNEVLEISELPILIAGYSPCYRKEAGAHGKDTKGIFRVHQFNKVEQFVFCLPEDSWTWIEKMIKAEEEIWTALDIPFRIINMCSGDLGKVSAQTYDLELWMPSQGKYREMVSCSNCTDYQSSRLNLRYAEKRGHPTKGFVHTLNSTVIATTRSITAILENNRQPDGRILIPKPLQKYLKPIEKAPDKYIIPIHPQE
jgi:seryl-tRNA synthetase